INAYQLLSLYHKQNGQPYSADLEGIENMIALMQKQARMSGHHLLDAEENKEISKNRYLEAYVHYVTGTRELERGNCSQAAQELEQAARLVPEDALASYYLGEAYDKLGREKAALKAKKHAEEINPCLK
ncbi:MAG: tetratricopeptide repeat protein, partial [Deltaproteobacteria bacterium]|nr:tetratricopeptide repeat protein [Deltaproteobacteria bacterium]